jgi:hypothetical protein
MPTDPMENCPKCGEEYDPKQDQIVMCPRCGNEGSTKCCNPAGQRCLCLECEEAQ